MVTGGHMTKKQHTPARLDVACGQNKAEGFTGIDIAGDADIVHDLFVFPWPIKTGSVEEVRCHHFVEHIPHHREGWTRDGWFLFWDEMWRICKPGARIEITHPYGRSDRAWWDPTHCRAVVDQSWYYLDAQWRDTQGLGHYPTVSDFEVVSISGLGVPDVIMNRNEDFRAFAQSFYVNVYADLHVILEKRGAA